MRKHQAITAVGHRSREVLSLGLMLVAACLCAAAPPATRPAGLPSPEEVVAARTDLWGEAAMSQPDGASYEFFRDLLPPLRWTNAEFRHYPLMLSAPRSPVKARLISNGSAVNALANKPPMWFEAGTPVIFSVGDPTRPSQGQFEGEPGVVPLYTLRYWWALLQRDEREKALVGFYGHLARGMTPHTFVGGEGVRFMHGDAHGRSFYLPPNSAGNAAFLLLLRYLIIQDWDLDGDGRPETLRLLYGVPRRWLRNESSIVMERAPSLFGEVSVQAQSRLSAGEVVVRMTAPPRPPHKVLLRVPLPSGWKVTGASIDGEALTPAADGAVDLTGRTGTYTVRFSVAQQ